MTLRANFEELRLAGPARVRRRLEALVNDGLITVAGAQRLYRQVFHAELRAIPARRAPRTLPGWLPVALWGIFAVLSYFALLIWSH